MKNILIVSDVYPPEVSSAATLMRELAEEIKKKGNKVWVVTSYPSHYLPDDYSEKNLSELSEENGVKVIRVKTLPLRKVNFVIRGISQLILPFIFFSKIKKIIGEKIDKVIVYSPPLTLALVGKRAKRHYGAEFIMNIQDIFPQNAVDLGILGGFRHRPAVWLFERIEKMAYENADLITFHSEGGRKFLIEKKKVPPEKILTIYNWVDFEQYRGLTRDISFRKKWGLENKFIFLFAGIMGPAQGVEFILKTAKGVADIQEIVFLLVGGGMEKDKVENLIKKQNLKNVLIKPFVSGEEYPYLLNEINVGLVCLSIRNKTPFIPGKILGYMAAGKPIIAFLNKESDGFEIIRKAGCGYAILSDNPDEAAAVVRKMYEDKEKQEEFGRKGLKYASENFTIGNCLEKLGL